MPTDVRLARPAGARRGRPAAPRPRRHGRARADVHRPALAAYDMARPTSLGVVRRRGVPRRALVRPRVLPASSSVVRVPFRARPVAGDLAGTSRDRSRCGPAARTPALPALPRVGARERASERFARAAASAASASASGRSAASRSAIVVDPADLAIDRPSAPSSKRSARSPRGRARSRDSIQVLRERRVIEHPELDEARDRALDQVLPVADATSAADGPRRSTAARGSRNRSAASSTTAGSSTRRATLAALGERLLAGACRHPRRPIARRP